MATIVSAFISNVNQRSNRNINDYLEYGKKLLAIPVNKIIFFDEACIHLLGSEYQNECTTIIPVNKRNEYLYDYIDQITNFAINTDLPEKDTIEYIIMMCHKTEYMEKAIRLNPYHSQQFVWLDFGIYHILETKTEETPTNTFEQSVLDLQKKEYTGIRIASIWNLPTLEYFSEKFNIGVYSDIMWVFAGGIFGGDTESLLLFSEQVKKKCIQVITERKSIVWEVNIWLLLMLENNTPFLPYYCDGHNSAMLLNY